MAMIAIRNFKGLETHVAEFIGPQGIQSRKTSHVKLKNASVKHKFYTDEHNKNKENKIQNKGNEISEESPWTLPHKQENPRTLPHKQENLRITYN